MEKEDWDRFLLVLLIVLGICAVGYAWWEKTNTLITTAGGPGKTCLVTRLTLKEETCYNESSKEIYVSVNMTGIRSEQEQYKLKAMQILVWNASNGYKSIEISKGAKMVQMINGGDVKLPSLEREEKYILDISDFPVPESIKIAPFIDDGRSVKLCDPTSIVEIKPCPPPADATRFVDGINKIISEGNKGQIQDMLDETSYAFIIVTLNDTGHMDEVLSSLPSNEFIALYVWESTYSFSGNATKEALIKLQNNPYVKDIHAARLTIPE